MMRNSSNSSSSSNGGSEIVGVSSKTRLEQEVDLGLKLQNQNRSFVCNQTDDKLRTTTRTTSCNDVDDDDGDGRRNGGPTLGGYNNTNSNDNATSTNTKLSDIYNVGDSSSVYSTAAAASIVVPSGSGVVRALQPFDVSSVSVASYPFFKSSSSGGMATGAIGFPFTAAQWKELERQAMIYKYMMASLPVPPDLLYSSFSSTPSATFAPAASYLLGKYGSGLNLRWVGNSKDAEPGRCRRTDGKKWRCSRDVAPNQKYCERHMHRGRPRSRKPVELLHHHHSLSDFPINNKNINAIKNNNNPTKKTKLNDPNPLGSSYASIPVSKASTFDHHPIMANSFEDSRSLAWTEEQQWQHLVQTNMNPQVFQSQFQVEPLNLNSHAGFNTKSDMGMLERPLIDAWSMGVTGTKANCGGNNKSCFTSNVGHVNAIDEDICQIHMGIGVNDSWAGSPTSPGGPLAEVLRPGAVASTATRSATNPTTFDVGQGDFITPPATAVSSPSGVLQKTLASFSDSSGSSSPTCHNSRPNSDLPFHWLN